MRETYYLLSLGCPKNEVDAEAMAYMLNIEGYDFVQDPHKADYIIINTCGFIDAAKMEAIDATLELSECKKKGSKLILTGCLPQRFMKEIYEDLPEVDAGLGTAQYDEIAKTLRSLRDDTFLKTDKLPRPGSLKHLGTGRILTPHRPFAYLKIAEGCSNMCAFCAIPYIRGPLISRPLDEVVAEAKFIESQGYQELILVAQDSSRYGLDLPKPSSLYDLCKRLLEETHFPWIRLMYTYGDALQKELIDLMAEDKRLVAYLDLPIQHASNRILKAMRRRETKEDIARTIDYLRATVPGISLRSTVLLGFPGETEDDVAELLSFIEEHPFDRLGAFAFSAEEKTPAARMKGLLPMAEREERRDRVMQKQKEIAEKLQSKRIGTVVPMLIEGVSDDGLFYLARSYAEAPEIDPMIYLLNEYPDELQPGQMVEGKIVAQDGYDLTALRFKQKPLF